MSNALQITLDSGRVLLRHGGQEIDIPYATVRNGFVRERWLTFYMYSVSERQGLRRAVHIESPLSRRTVNTLLYGPSIMRKKIRRALEVTQ